MAEQRYRFGGPVPEKALKLRVRRERRAEIAEWSKRTALSACSACSQCLRGPAVPTPCAAIDALEKWDALGFRPSQVIGRQPTPGASQLALQTPLLPKAIR